MPCTMLKALSPSNNPQRSVLLIVYLYFTQRKLSLGEVSNLPKVTYEYNWDSNPVAQFCSKSHAP